MKKVLFVTMTVLFSTIMASLAHSATLTCLENCTKSFEFIILDDSGTTFTPNPYTNGTLDLHDLNTDTDRFSVKEPKKDEESSEKISPVPLPAALGLLISGLSFIFGLGFYRLAKKTD
jgi:hypothetical protein